jgi:putative heme transporter
MSILDRLRGARRRQAPAEAVVHRPEHEPAPVPGTTPPPPSADVQPSRRPGARPAGPRPEDRVDAVVEMRPSSKQPRTRFGQLERAATAVALWVLRVLVIVAGLVGLVWVLRETWSIVLPVVLALILTTVLYPLARLLRRHMPDALAALVVLLLFFGAIIGLFSILIPRVIDQASGLSDQVIGGFERLQRTFVSATQDGFLGIEGDQISQWVDQGVERLQQNAQTIASSVGGGLLTGLFSVGSGLVTFLLVLVLTFFFLKDGHRFLPWLHLWTGTRVAEHADALLGRTWKTLGGYIGSQAAVALVDAVFIGIGLFFLDVPFALPLAVLIFFAAFIPIVGAVSTGALAVLVALFANGLTNALLVLAVVLVVQQLESNLLQPLLVGKALALHPAVVIGSVTVGGTLFGIIGAFLAVPIAAVGTVALRYVREAVRGEEPQKDHGEGDGSAPMGGGTGKEVDEVSKRKDADARDVVDQQA